MPTTEVHWPSFIQAIRKNIPRSKHCFECTEWLWNGSILA